VKSISPGRIIWHVAPSGRGEGKIRPLIIVTRRIDYLQGRPVVAIGCSTDFPSSKPEMEIRLEYHPQRRCLTELPEATVAVCDWIETFPPRTVFDNLGGMIGGNQLKEIVERAGLVFIPER
jgi:hypothetical protein